MLHKVIIITIYVMERAIWSCFKAIVIIHKVWLNYVQSEERSVADSCKVLAVKPKVQAKHELDLLVLLPDQILDTVLIKTNLC